METKKTKQAFTRRVRDDFGALMMMQAVLDAGGTVVAVMKDDDMRFDMRWHVFAVLNDVDEINDVDNRYEALIR